MSRLQRVYWKDLPPEETEILNPHFRHRHEGGASLRPFVEATLENGEFVEFVLPQEQGPKETKTSHAKAGAETVQLFLDESRSKQNWQEASQALKEKTLCLKEMPDKPQVHYIEAENQKHDPVFLPAGLAFEGGAQNRMVLDSHLLRHGRHHLPVFCIEAGRWGEPASTPFHKIRRLPDLMMLHFLNKNNGQNSSFAEKQVAFWELVLEALSLSNAENPSMNLFYNPDQKEPEKSTSQNGASAKIPEGGLPKKSRGFFAHDPRSALSVLRISPGFEHLKENIRNYTEELRWRRRLRQHAAGARRYFRIFDADKKIAIQCDPKGMPYKTLRKRPVLFPYQEGDLKHSFVPPIEPPPDPPEIQFADVSHSRRSVRECLELLKECEGSLQKIGKDLYRMRFSHPKLCLQGNALLCQGGLADLDMLLFEGNATALQN